VPDMSNRLLYPVRATLEVVAFEDVFHHTNFVFAKVGIDGIHCIEQGVEVIYVEEDGDGSAFAGEVDGFCAAGHVFHQFLQVT